TARRKSAISAAVRPCFAVVSRRLRGAARSAFADGGSGGARFAWAFACLCSCLSSASPLAGAFAATPPRPVLFGRILQPSLSIQGRHAAGAGAGDGLAIDVVLNIARGENAGNGGHGGQALQAASGNDVTIFHFELPFENGRIGLMADRNE